MAIHYNIPQEGEPFGKKQWTKRTESVGSRDCRSPVQGTGDRHRPDQKARRSRRLRPHHRDFPWQRHPSCRKRTETGRHRRGNFSLLQVARTKLPHQQSRRPQGRRFIF